MPKTVKNWPFDLAPLANQSFWDIDKWAILKVSIASKIKPKIKKKNNEAFLRYFRKSQFLCSKWAKKETLGPRLGFFQKSGSVTFEYLWWLNIMQNVKRTNERFLRNQRNRGMDGRMDERTDGQDWNYRTLLLKRGSNEWSF